MLPFRLEICPGPVSLVSLSGPVSLSIYAQAAAEAGLTLANLHEPLLTEDSAVTVTQGPIAQANAAAWSGLPGVIVWDFVKRAAP